MESNDSKKNVKFNQVQDSTESCTTVEDPELHVSFPMSERVLESNEDCGAIENKYDSKEPSDNETVYDEDNQTQIEEHSSPHKSDPVLDITKLRRDGVVIVSDILATSEIKLKGLLIEKERLMKGSIDKISLEGTTHISYVPDDDVNLLKRIVGNGMVDEDSTSKTKNVKNETHLKDMSKTCAQGEFTKKIEIQIRKFDPYYDLDPDTICGIGCFKPKWLQSWATERVYVVLYSIIGILSGSYYSYLIGSLSTLEKRFVFKSKISGVIMTLDEITPLLLGVLIGYFGGRAHRPRMVAFGMLLSSICCFVSALPYFIYGPATHLTSTISIQNKTTDLCDTDAEVQRCEESDRPPTLAAVLFLMLGSFLKGFGNLAYYAIGLTYMDDNAKKANTPMYLAVALSLRLLGPFLGFIMSSAFLKMYENPFVDPGFGRDDPRWIGGWWMGFLLQGFLLLLFTIPVSLFPRRLPGHRKPESKGGNDPVKVLQFKGLYHALKRLAKNPLYMLFICNNVMLIFAKFGMYIMLPKYMENQFRLSSSQASLFAGPPGLFVVIVLTLLGGCLIYRFKPNAKVLTRFMLATEVLWALGFIVLMLPRCDKVELTYNGLNDDGLILEDTCNANCSCTTKAFAPVCGPDGKSVYFSPCHAGCSQSLNTTFTNCSCVVDSSGLDRDFVTEGFCVSEGCWTQAITYVTIDSIASLNNILNVGRTMLLLRIVNPEDKSVAMGSCEAISSGLGFIPLPIVYGALVDSACLVWEKSCGRTGNCWFYDMDKLNYLLHGTSSAFAALSATFLAGICFLSSRIYDMYKEEETKEKEKKQQTENTVL